MGAYPCTMKAGLVLHMTFKAYNRCCMWAKKNMPGCEGQLLHGDVCSFDGAVGNGADHKL